MLRSFPRFYFTLRLAGWVSEKQTRTISAPRLVNIGQQQDSALLRSNLKVCRIVNIGQQRQDFNYQDVTLRTFLSSYFRNLYSEQLTKNNHFRSELLAVLFQVNIQKYWIYGSDFRFNSALGRLGQQQEDYGLLKLVCIADSLTLELTRTECSKAGLTTLKWAGPAGRG